MKQIVFGGGVAANSYLRQRFRQHTDLDVIFPSLKFCTDNAAMVAACGYYHLQANKTNGLDLDVIPGLKLG